MIKASIGDCIAEEFYSAKFPCLLLQPTHSIGWPVLAGKALHHIEEGLGSGKADLNKDDAFRAGEEPAGTYLGCPWCVGEDVYMPCHDKVPRELIHRVAIQVVIEQRHLCILWIHVVLPLQ